MPTNPLLKSQNTFDNAVNFEHITPKLLLEAQKILQEQAMAQVEKIVNNPQPASFANTIIALEHVLNTPSLAYSVFGNLSSSCHSHEIDEIAPEFLKSASQFNSSIYLHGGLFKRIKQVHDNATSGLDQQDLRLMTNFYNAFVRNGALLSQSDQEKIRTIDHEMSEIYNSFSKHVLKSTNETLLFAESEAEVKGIPNKILTNAKKLAESNGFPQKWAFNLQPPVVMQILEHGCDRILREKIFKFYNSRCTAGEYYNFDLIEKLTRLRAERAQILGFENHAAYVTEDRMARNPQTVFDFLKKLEGYYVPAAKKDFELISSYAKADGIDQLEAWDFPFYAERLIEEKYSLNDEEIRQYFPVEKCMDGIFHLGKKLYGVEFRRRNDIPTYHPTVQVYQVIDAKDESYVGLLYVDLFSRNEKRPGAWASSFHSQGLKPDGTSQRPHVTMTCNYPPPTPDHPCLLSLDEVRTLFHEFGHCLHMLLSNVKYQSLSGTNVLWDFVELPSQIMENWVDEKSSLDTFARHYLTGEPMPQSLFDKIHIARNFLAGWYGMRQVSLALIDMAWHVRKVGQTMDPYQVEYAATLNRFFFKPFQGQSVSASFSHIFAGGYSAGYYSYKWAEALDADAFAYFKEKGIYDPEVASKFRENILSKGDSEPPDVLYRRFRGRDADPNALLHRSGLL